METGQLVFLVDTREKETAVGVERSQIWRIAVLASENMDFEGAASYLRFCGYRVEVMPQVVSTDPG